MSEYYYFFVMRMQALITIIQLSYLYDLWFGLQFAFYLWKKKDYNNDNNNKENSF